MSRPIFRSRTAGNWEIAAHLSGARVIWQRLTQLCSSRSNDSRTPPGEPQACCSLRLTYRQQRTK